MTSNIKFYERRNYEAVTEYFISLGYWVMVVERARRNITDGCKFSLQFISGSVDVNA